MVTLLGPVDFSPCGDWGQGDKLWEGQKMGLLPSSKGSSVFTKHTSRRLDFSVSVKSSTEQKGERGIRGKGKNILS